MGHSIRRWGRQLLWIIPALLVLYGTAKLGDFIWFRTQIPLGFRDPNWTGTWQTEQYGLSGRLLVRMPDPLPENEDFRAEALVYYPVYSVWKTGQFVKIDFVGHFSPEDLASAGESTGSLPPTGGKLKFKATTGKQIIDYAALIEPSQRTIVGGYLSQSPDDYGFFSIRYY